MLGLVPDTVNYALIASHTSDALVVAHELLAAAGILGDVDPEEAERALAGELGFDARETYFGDEQQAFSDALAERGFAINRGATFESGHRTRSSIPILMCPQYYVITSYSIHYTKLYEILFSNST